MKPSLSTPRRLSPHLRKSCLSLLAVAVASGLNANVAYSQATAGNFYAPGTPGYNPSTPGFVADTGHQPAASYNDLAYLESILNATTDPATSKPLTLKNPPPAGFTLASDAQYVAAVNTAASNIVTNSGVIPAGVTPATFAQAAVTNRPVDAYYTVDAISNQIIANSSPGPAVGNLINVITTLATNYSTPITSSIPSLFARVAANNGVAPALPGLVVTATTTGAPNDATIGTVILQAFAEAASVPTTFAIRQSLVKSIITDEISAPAIANSPAALQSLAAGMTNNAVLQSAGLQVSDVLYQALASYSSPARQYTPFGIASMSALVTGSLENGTNYNQANTPGVPNYQTIQTFFDQYNPGTSPYTDQIVAGFKQAAFYPSAVAFANNSYIGSNSAYADAIVAGAIIKGTIPPANLVGIALLQGTATPPANIVAAAITADLSNGNATNSTAVAAGAINPNTKAPYAGTFLAISQAAVGAARAADAGSIAYMLVSSSLLNTTDVQSIVNGAVTGAYVTGKQSALSNIVFNSVQATGNNSADQTAAVTQAIVSMRAQDPSNANLPTYIVAASALAGSTGTANLSAIQTAANNQDNTSNAGNGNAAINAAYNIVSSIRTNMTTAFKTTLATFTAAMPQDQVLAVLYGASLADPGDASAILASSIAKTTTVTNSNLLTAAINASQDPAATNPQKQSKLTALSVANAVATHIEANILSGHNTDLFDFVGYQTLQNPNNLFDVAAAASTVDPNHVHYEAHAIAFNSPVNAYNAVPALFAYSQLNTKNRNNSAAPIDQTSAAAAIVAGLTTGVVETKSSPAMSQATVQTALNNIIQQSVIAAVQQNGQLLTGAIISQSDGTASGFTLTPSVGAAGVITGFVAQVVTPGQTTIGSTGSAGSNPFTGDASAILTKAVIQTIFQTAATNASAYVLQMAQAAGQALRFVAGSTVLADPFNGATGTAAYDIAQGFFVSGSTSPTFAQIQNAANYGINQAIASIVGAGASGIVNYTQHSSIGTPVTDIFNL